MSQRRALLPKMAMSSSSSWSFLSSPSTSSYASAFAGSGREVMAATEEGHDGGGSADEDRWSRMLPELLGEIMRRVEESEKAWPARRSVVACACVCRRWREAALEVVGPLRETGLITIPASLKEPGPRSLPIQCFIKRDKKKAMFYLYLCLTHSLVDKGKFLLAARRFRRGTRTEYIISLDADDLSQGSKAYVGKLSSDFLGTKYTLYDSRPPYEGAKASCNRASRRFTSKQISPQVPSKNFEIGQVCYKFNFVKSRGPRRMTCKLQCPVKETMEEALDCEKHTKSTNLGALTLKNKAPRWHDHLQCWCLNFHGRVTVASVKNFQLVATADPRQPGGVADEETVLLQFGKVNDDMFTMDYRDPLSAFQAFAICLTSFGTKLACE